MSYYNHVIVVFSKENKLDYRFAGQFLPQYAVLKAIISLNKNWTILLSDDEDVIAYLQKKWPDFKGLVMTRPEAKVMWSFGISSGAARLGTKDRPASPSYPCQVHTVHNQDYEIVEVINDKDLHPIVNDYFAITSRQVVIEA